MKDKKTRTLRGKTRQTAKEQGHRKKRQQCEIKGGRLGVVAWKYADQTRKILNNRPGNQGGGRRRAQTNLDR